MAPSHESQPRGPPGAPSVPWASWGPPLGSIRADQPPGAPWGGLWAAGGVRMGRGGPDLDQI